MSRHWARLAFTCVSVWCRGGSVLNPRGGQAAAAEAAQAGVGVDSALLNLLHGREMGPVVAAAVSAPQAEAGH